MSNEDPNASTSHEAAGLTRRRFVATAIASTVIAGVGAAGLLSRSASAVELRPPGFVSENDLLARCNRCQRCVQACPYGIVQPLALTVDDFVSVGTPGLAFKVGYCDFCMKCIEACPTGALRDAEINGWNLGTAKVVYDACVAWEWTGCDVCVDACPVDGAIMLDANKRPKVNESLCNGCGKCEFVCPASSLRSYRNETLEKGIYVVPPDSAIASIRGEVSSVQMIAGRRVGLEG